MIQDSSDKQEYKPDNEEKTGENVVIPGCGNKFFKSSAVTHHHHLKAGLIISILLFMLLMISIGGLYDTYQKANDYQEGAYKYEYIKLNGDKNSLNHLKKLIAFFGIIELR